MKKKKQGWIGKDGELYGLVKIIKWITPALIIMTAILLPTYRQTARIAQVETEIAERSQPSVTESATGITAEEPGRFPRGRSARKAETGWERVVYWIQDSLTRIKVKVGQWLE